jgi:hypothetical protein
MYTSLKQILYIIFMIFLLGLTLKQMDSLSSNFDILPLFIIAFFIFLMFFIWINLRIPMKLTCQK